MCGVCWKAPTNGDETFFLRQAVPVTGSPSFGWLSTIVFAPIRHWVSAAVRQSLRARCLAPTRVDDGPFQLSSAVVADMRDAREGDEENNRFTVAESREGTEPLVCVSSV